MVTIPSGEAAPADGFMEWEYPAPRRPRGWPEDREGRRSTPSDRRTARQRKIDEAIESEGPRGRLRSLRQALRGHRRRISVAAPFTVEGPAPPLGRGRTEHGKLIEEIDASEGPARPEAAGGRELSAPQIIGEPEEGRRSPGRQGDAIRFEA